MYVDRKMRARIYRHYLGLKRELARFCEHKFITKAEAKKIEKKIDRYYDGEKASMRRINAPFAKPPGRPRNKAPEQPRFCEFPGCHLKPKKGFRHCSAEHAPRLLCDLADDAS